MSTNYTPEQEAEFLSKLQKVRNEMLVLMDLYVEAKEKERELVNARLEAMGLTMKQSS